MRCKVDKDTEIFQPMWTDGHWYLMVVDVRRKKLMYFDSFKCTTETESRKLAMTQVALNLESLTIRPKWLSKCTVEQPRFSSYVFEEPIVPQQHRLSMDYGVWVLQWMIRGALWAIHSVTAIDVVEKAMCYWRRKAGSSRHGHEQ
ncbi:Ulp1 protease family, carboxy-terminal domain protein [Arachis hypogaea]|nr:Ulp1 protease family, carboxy-terminal domain protein [Arachis hypogaea]